MTCFTLFKGVVNVLIWYNHNIVFYYIIQTLYFMKLEYVVNRVM